MADFGPWARIFLRYGLGYVLGAELGAQLAMDKDLVVAVSVGMAAAIEAFYVYAKRKGLAT
jgi:hypothetical protein